MHLLHLNTALCDSDPHASSASCLARLLQDSLPGQGTGHDLVCFAPALLCDRMSKGRLQEDIDTHGIEHLTK